MATAVQYFCMIYYNFGTSLLNLQEVKIVGYQDEVKIEITREMTEMGFSLES